jgi:hypothetical protein
MDAWILRLKEAYDAGYYKTEPAIGEQTLLPWPTQIGRWRASWLTGPSLCPPESTPPRPSPHEQEPVPRRPADPVLATMPAVQTMPPSPRETFLSRCVRLLKRQ